MRRRLGSLEKGGGMVPRDAQDSDQKRSSSKSIDDLSDEEASEFLGALRPTYEPMRPHSSSIPTSHPSA